MKSAKAHQLVLRLKVNNVKSRFCGIISVVFQPSNKSKKLAIIKKQKYRESVTSNKLVHS